MTCNTKKKFLEGRSKYLVKMPDGKKTRGAYTKELSRPTDAERALTREAAKRRDRQMAKLCVQKPGTVVLGRYGVVQYPFRYGYHQLRVGVKYMRIGKLYQ